jgi:hypothetical protein
MRGLDALAERPVAGRELRSPLVVRVEALFTRLLS